MDCNNKLKEVKGGQVVTAVRETDGYTELAEALESYHTGGGLEDLEDSKALFALTTAELKARLDLMGERYLPSTKRRLVVKYIEALADAFPDDYTPPSLPVSPAVSPAPSQPPSEVGGRSADASQAGAMSEAVARIGASPSTGRRPQAPLGGGVLGELRAALPGGPAPVSSPSSSDDDTPDDPPVPTQHSRRADDRIAGIIWRRMVQGGHRTALDYVRRYEFKNARSGHEARRVAQAIDALMSEKVSPAFLGMEILFRTLAGLQLADESADATLLDEMEWAPPEAIVPRDIFRTIVKDARRRRDLKPKPPVVAAPGVGKNGTRGGAQQ
jgi:hypothetical protein